MSKKWKYLELLMLFILLPLLMKNHVIPLPRIIVLLIVFIVILIVIINRKYLTKKWYKIPKLPANYWIKMGLIYLSSFVIFIAYISLILDEKPFMIFRLRPQLMILISIFYPLVSAFPQEIIYRTFYFHRYKNVFTERQLIISNMLAFSFLHIIYDNYPALILTLLSGLIFTCNYYRYKSLLLVTIEHSVLGLIVFFTGMGQYFYK